MRSSPQVSYSNKYLYTQRDIVIILYARRFNLKPHYNVFNLYFDINSNLFLSCVDMTAIFTVMYVCIFTEISSLINVTL